MKSATDVVSNEEIEKWIKDIFSFGCRRPGTRADAKAEDYIVKKLEGFGLTEVEKQPYQFTRWEAQKWRLTVDGEDIPCFYTPNTAFTEEDGVESELVYVGDGTQEEFEKTDVDGRIVLLKAHFPLLQAGLLTSLAYFVWDPEETLKKFGHPATWLYPNWWQAYRLAGTHGAEAIVGILSDYPTNENRIYIPYHGPLHYELPEWYISHIGLTGQIEKWIPGLWLGREDGENLIRTVEAAGGSVRANLLLRGYTEPATTHNIVAFLPGQSEDTIVVHSHHDGPWESAVEDASGVAEVLAVAEHMAKTPESERQKTLVFLFTGTHFGGPARGDLTFIESNPQITSKLVLDVCIEHIAKDFDAENGEWVDTGEPEPRGVFTQGGNKEATKRLVDALAEETEKHDLRRTIILPGDTPLGVPTDANALYRSGYPLYSYISGPEYLFDPCDTMDRVAVDQLNPVASVFIQAIRKVDKAPPSKIRGG
ncbi:MAG: M28 family peptidase [Candidatus Freyarchaeota archaeon]